jgi:hypothetical protein
MAWTSCLKTKFFLFDNPCISSFKAGDVSANIITRPSVPNESPVGEILQRKSVEISYLKRWSL